MRVNNSYKTLRNLREVPITVASGISQNNDFNKVDPGSLIYCSNYLVLDSTHTGTTSSMGFERYDGYKRTIADPNDSTINIDVTAASEVPVVYNSDYSDADDTARENFRSQVSALPSTFKRVGFAYLNSVEYVVGYNTSSNHVEVYTTSDTGWNKVADTLVSNYDLSEEVSYQTDTGRFASFPAGQTFNRQVVAVCTNLSNAFLLHQDTSGNVIITEVTHADLPASPQRPRTIKIFDNQLWLGYGEGHLFNSDTGDPLEYDQSVSTANEWKLPHEIFNMVEVPSGMIIFMEYGSEIIRLTDVDLSTGNDKVKENYSSETMVKKNTTVKYMGAIIYCSKRGIGMIKGGNEASVQNMILTKRVQELYRDIYEDIVSADVDRKTNQYEVYTKSGKILSLNISAEKRVNAIGVIDLGYRIDIAHTSTDSDTKYFFFEDNNFMYRMNTDITSFDGEPIRTSLTTAFYNYGMQNHLKNLMRVVLLYSAPPGSVISLYPIFDYSQRGVATSPIFTSPPTPSADRYGSSYWGKRRYGSAGVVHEYVFPCNGRGTRIAFKIETSSKFHTQHTIHSITPSIVINGIKV